MQRLPDEGRTEINEIVHSNADTDKNSPGNSLGRTIFPIPHESSNWPTLASQYSRYRTKVAPSIGQFRIFPMVHRAPSSNRPLKRHSHAHCTSASAFLVGGSANASQFPRRQASTTSVPPTPPARAIRRREEHATLRAEFVASSTPYLYYSSISSTSCVRNFEEDTEEQRIE